MPEKKPAVAFDVPSDVRTASQSGWVYRSDAAATLAVSPLPAAPQDSAPAAAAAMAGAVPQVPPAGAVRRAPVAGASWVDTATDLLALPFSVPLCFILSLASPPRRTNPK